MLKTPPQVAPIPLTRGRVSFFLPWRTFFRREDSPTVSPPLPRLRVPSWRRGPFVTPVITRPGPPIRRFRLYQRCNLFHVRRSPPFARLRDTILFSSHRRRLLGKGLAAFLALLSPPRVFGRIPLFSSEPSPVRRDVFPLVPPLFPPGRRSAGWAFP